DVGRRAIARARRDRARDQPARVEHTRRTEVRRTARVDHHHRSRSRACDARAERRPRARLDRRHHHVPAPPPFAPLMEVATADRYAHPAAAPYLAGTDAMGGALHRSGFSAEAWQYFLDAGYVLDDELLTALPSAGYDVDAYAVKPCPANHALVDGDVVDLGDLAFEVLHLPGHSPDSIGLFDRANSVLFSGDAVYDGPLLDGLYDGYAEQYVATMERLRALPVEVVHGGHEASFGRDRLVKLCDAYLARAPLR